MEAQGVVEADPEPVLDRYRCRDIRVPRHVPATGGLEHCANLEPQAQSTQYYSVFVTCEALYYYADDAAVRIFLAAPLKTL